MSATIDERVVEMKFDNKDFEKNVGTSLTTLEKLQGALKFDNATDSIKRLQQATNNVNFNPIAAGIDTLSDRFSAMGIVGMTVIQNLTNAALNFANQWLTTIPNKIIQGGWTRAMNIENAHFQLQGLIDDEKEVKRVMDQASESVNGTAYSYDSAAKAASMFAATGLKSGQEMENALKGIAGVAATTNADYESISHIFTTVAGNGRVMGEQLQQLSYRGMNAAAALVKYFNGVHDGSIQASDSVKNTINSILGSQDTIVKSATQVKEALEKEYEAAQKAYSKEYEAMQKALNKEYKAYQKALNKEYDLKKETYDKEYEALQESLQEEIDAQKEANSKRIEEANKAYENDVENYRKATEEKISLIDEEYKESLKLIDEEKYNRLKAIDDEINGINAAAEAEEKQRKEQERAAKIEELTKAVSSARTIKEREKAQKALDDYNKKVAQEKLAEERKARIKELQEQKDAIKEDAELQKEAAKEKRDEAVKAVNEEYNAKMKEMSEAHKKEIEELQKVQAEELKILQKANKEKLSEFRKAQSEELEAFKEGQNEEAEAYREAQQEQLNALRETNNEKLKELKKVQAEQEKATSSFATSAGINEATIRDMVSKGLISFEVFSEAMATMFGDHAKDANQTFTGALANIGAALARTGAMFFSPLIEQEGEAVQLFNAIRLKINDMNGELKSFATDSTSVINDFIKKLGNAVKKVPIKDITAVATNAMRAFGNIFGFVGKLIRPIAEAFSNVFLSFDTKKIVTASEAFLELTEKLQISVRETDKIKYAFMEVFNVFKNVFNLVKKFFSGFKSQFGGIEVSFQKIFEILTNVRNKLMWYNNFVLKSKDTQDKFTEAGKKVADIIKTIIDAFSVFFTAIGSGINSVITFVQTSEDLQRIFKALKEIVSKIGKKITDFFDNMKKSFDDTDTTKLDILKEKFGFLEGPLNFLKEVGKKTIKVIADLLEKVNDFIGVDTSGFTSLTDVLEKLEKPIEFLKNVGIGVFETLKKILEPLGKAIKDLLAEVWNILSGTNPIETLIAYINTKLLGGIGKTIINLYEMIHKLMVETLLASLTEFIMQLVQIFGKLENGGLERFANAMKSMAEAILMLAISCLVLQSIDAEGLTKAAVAIGVLLGELVGAYLAVRKLSPSQSLFSFFGGKDGKLLEYGSAGSFGATVLEMAAAIAVLSVACYGLSKMDIDALVKGISAVSVLLWELAAVAITMNKAGGNKAISGAGGALLGMSIALLIIVGAVKKLAALDMESLLKGVGAVSALILVLGGFVQMSGGATKMIAVGLGLIATAGAVLMLTSAVSKLAELDIASLLQGVGAVSSLIVVLGAFTMMAGGATKLISIGLGLLAVAGAVSIITDAVSRLSEVNPENLLGSVTALSTLLVVISVCLSVLGPSDAIAALGVLEVAVAVVAIGHTLKELNGLDDESLLNSAIALSAILGVIALCLVAIPPTAAISAIGAMEMAVTVVAIGFSLKQLSGIADEALLNSTLALIAIIGAISICLMAIPPTAAIGGLGAIEMALSMVAIAKSLEILSSVPADRMLDVTLSMVAILAAMSACLLVIPPTAIVGGLAAIEMAASMIIVAKSLEILAAIDPKALATALLGFLGAMTILTAVLTALGAIGTIAVVGAGVLLAMAASLSGSALILCPALYAMADAIEYWGKLDPEKFSKSIEMIGSALKTVGGSLKSFNLFAKRSSEALKTTAEGLLLLGPAMMVFIALDPDKLKKSFELVGEGISIFGKSLKKFGLLSEIGASALEMVAKAIAIMAPALTMLSLTDPEKIATQMETLGEGFAKFGDALDSYNIFSGIGADAIKSIAESINLLAPALTLLQIVNPESTSDILEALGNAFKSFGEALEAAPFWGAKSRAEGISLLVDDVKLLADALPPLMDMDASKLQSVLSTIGNAFKDFGTALSNAPFWAPDDRGEAIGILVQEIDDLAAVLPAFMELDADAAKDSLGTIGKAFKDFGKALNNAPFWGVENRGEAIKTLVGSIETLANGLNTFINYNFDGESLKNTLGQITTGFTEFGKSLTSATYWNPENRGEAISILVDSVRSLAKGLAFFIEKVDGEKVEDAITWIAKAFKDFADTLKHTPWFGVGERAKAIGTLIDNLENLSNGIAYFIQNTEGKEDTAQSVLSTIGTALKDFGEAIKNSPFWGTKKRADALISVVDNLNSIADVVARLSEIGSAADVSTYLHSIASCVTSLGNGIQKFKGVNKSTMENFQNSLSIVSAFATIDVTNLANALVEFEKIPSIIAGLSTIDFTALNTVRTELMHFMTDMSIVSAGIGSVISTVLAEIALAESKLQNAGKNMSNGVLKGMASMITQFTKVGLSLASQFDLAITASSSKALLAGSNLSRAVVNGILSYTVLFQNAGFNLSSAFFAVLSATVVLSKALEAGTNLSKTVLNGVSTYSDVFKVLGMELAMVFLNGLVQARNTAESVGRGISENVYNGIISYENRFEHAGEYAGYGFIRGLYSRIEDAYDAGRRLGEAAYYAARRALDEHSPSRKMEEIGDYAGEGFIRAFRAYIYDSEETGEEIGKSAMFGLKEAVTKNMDIPDLMNPTISPSLDLSNIEKGVGALDSMLRPDRTIGLSSDINLDVNKANVMGNLMGSLVDTTTSGDEMIYNSLEGLRSDLANLQRVVGNLKVVMDSGTLVGEIAPGMDMALGQMSNLKRRGV